MFIRLFLYPSNNLPIVIPVVLIIGFIVGSLTDLSALKNWILPATFCMIYPTMIGFRLQEAFNLSHGVI